MERVNFSEASRDRAALIERFWRSDYPDRNRGGYRKLTKTQVRDIRVAIVAGQTSLRQIGRNHNVSLDVICKIRDGVYHKGVV